MIEVVLSGVRERITGGGVALEDKVGERASLGFLVISSAPKSWELSRFSTER